MNLHTFILPSTAFDAMDRMIEALARSELVAFPTDTVYGLAAPAFDPVAIGRLFEVKDRDSLKAIAVLVGQVEDLSLVTSGLSDMARRLAEKFWPGPLTLVVARHAALPENISPYPTIGVRMPDHPLALNLLRHTGPLAVTSANRSGGANTTTAQAVREQLGGRIGLILDGGETPGGTPSTVVDCTGKEPVILRSGPISLEDLKAAL